MSALNDWNEEAFGNIFFRKQKILNQIQRIKKSLETHHDFYLERLNKKLIEELQSILLEEVAYWKQKSRDQWLALGDKNTSYFHSPATLNKGRNHIWAVKHYNDILILDKESLKNLAKDFFHATLLW